MEAIMLQIKRLLIILLVLFCCCSKRNSDEKIYRTAVSDLRVYADPEKRYVGQGIGRIPFKARVEIVDNNEVKGGDLSFIKIKYNDTIGYVNSSRLSERSDIPFVDNVKYDYTLNEFAYDREKVIDLARQAMTEYDSYTKPLTSYYIEDPQIFSFYGKDCNENDTKYILVIIISKLCKNFNYHVTLFSINSKDEYRVWGCGSGGFTESDEGIKDYIKLLRSGDNGDCP